MWSCFTQSLVLVLFRSVPSMVEGSSGELGRDTISKVSEQSAALNIGRGSSPEEFLTAFVVDNMKSCRLWD